MYKFSNKIPQFLKKKWVIAVIALFVLIFGGYFIFHKAPTYQFVPVTRGSIIESVSLTGNTTPAQSVALSFGSSGIISRIYSDVGKQVRAGQILAELNTNDLVAQLHQAQANVSAEQARLQSLQSGSRPEDLAVAQVNLDNAKTDLLNTKSQQDTLVTNAYRALLNSTLAAYPVSSTSSNVAASTPTISGTYIGDNQGAIRIETVGTGTSGYFNATGLVTANGSVSINAIPIGTSGLYISFPAIYNSGSGMIWSIPIPNTQASNYIANLNAYNSALTAKSAAVAKAEANVAELQAQLDLKKAGSSATDISAQQAGVQQAEASVESAAAKLQNARIVAPISGIVTQFDAKVGQLAGPGTSLVSIMSSGGYEVDSGVSETDVGKMTIGNKVTMTLDAFPNETFTGSVFYIAPSETNTQGVVSYQVKISFDVPDTRFKSGLTANIDIQTKQKDNVLMLPQYAILQNDSGTFVETLEANKVKQNPVTLGIQDQKGNVEVISGVSEGEQVLNIGLKATQ